jgi:hypothetical protein
MNGRPAALLVGQNKVSTGSVDVEITLPVVGFLLWGWAFFPFSLFSRSPSGAKNLLIPHFRSRIRIVKGR